MTERPERDDDTNARREHLTFVQAAERLHISADAVRMRVRRGTLASVRENDRTLVVWPQPEPTHERRTERPPERTRSERRATVQTDARLIDRLEADITFLQAELADRTEEIRRRDHIIAGLVEQLRALPAGGTVDDAARNEMQTPRSDVRTEQAPDSLLDRVRRLVGRR
jgi:hypothetical protein